MEWQPIETAPKDGTPILLYVPVNGRMIAIEGEWGKYPDCGEGEEGWRLVRANCHGCGCCASQDGMPTHWLPLPY